MFFNWKGIALVLTVIAAVIGLCALDLSCGGGPTADSTLAKVQGELKAGRQELRTLKAEELAGLARDMHALAKMYRDQGEKKKAYHALAAAQELERKIRQLRGEE